MAGADNYDIIFFGINKHLIAMGRRDSVAIMIGANVTECRMLAGLGSNLGIL
jgi:hypothetical protein